MKNNLLQKLKDLNIVIASHVFATGPALELEEYLKEKAKSLLFIGLPFSSRRDKKHFARYHKSGKLTDQSFGTGIKFPSFFQYLRDALYVILKTLSFPGKVNLFIGSDNFSAYIGLIFKWLGKTDKVVLYTIDYLPNRFKNPILNSIYHFLDRQCLKYCDIVWNVSPVMASAREQFGGIKIEKSSLQIVVPLGVWYNRIPKVPFAKRKRYQIIFMGHLLEKQGLDVVLESLPKLLKQLPRLRLMVLGTGEYEDHLKGLVKKLKIEDRVIFTGYVERHEDIEEELAKSALALAMYKPDPKSFTNWSDPGKLKNYLAAGLPIVLTSVPWIAKELQRKRCAVICEYNVESFSQAILKVLSNDKTMQEYSRNATEFSKHFDWDDVFASALNKTLD